MDNNRIDMGKVDRDLSRLEWVWVAVGIGAIIVVALAIYLVNTGVLHVAY